MMGQVAGTAGRPARRAPRFRMASLPVSLLAAALAASPASAQTRSVQVDCGTPIGPIKSLQGMNSGPMGIFPGAVELGPQFREVGVDYVRTHDVRRGPAPPFGRPWDIDVIFPDSLADPALPSSYRFAAADSQIQAILDAGARPFVRLGYSAGSRVRYIAPGYRSKWADICKHIIMHLNGGWAGGFFHGIQHWEIWNEPNSAGFWTGTQPEFNALYDLTARTLKGYDPSLRIGGPGTAGAPANWVTNFLAYCRNNQVPLDFFSWHMYGDTLRCDAYNVFRMSAQVEQLLGAQGLAIPQYLTEWNITIPPPSTFYENMTGAAYTASFLTYMQNTTIAQAHRYRANDHGFLGTDAGTWYWDGRTKKPGFSFLAFRRVLETPLRLLCSGTDTLGTTAIAGKAPGGDAVTVLLSDVASSSTGYDLEVRNLPWGDAGFLYERFVLDGSHDLELVEAESGSGSTFAVQEAMAAPSVHLIRFTRLPLAAAEAATGARGGELILEMAPNPFSSWTAIRCSGPFRAKDGGGPAAARVGIYDLSGRLVRSFDGVLPGSALLVLWDGRDELGRRTASGVYYCRLVAPDLTATGSCMLVR